MLSSLSILSFGSVLSVLSIGSTFSAFSVGSINSFASVGSYGCSFRVFSNCHRPPKDNGLHFDILVEDATWDAMSTCSFEDYQQFKKFTTDDTPCGYKRAKCHYSNNDANISLKLNCKVRRKGFTTFQSMDAMPSFNVKFYDDAWKKDDVTFGTFDGVVFTADKIRLNNMAFSNSWSGLTEVHAYDTFRRMGYAYMPVARDITLSTFKGVEQQASYGAALIEVIDNDDYFKRPDVPFGNDYMVFEVDNTGTELKDAEGIFKGNVDTHLLEGILNRDVEDGKTDGVIDHMDRYETLTYYAGERLTRSWDGACLSMIPNNVYIIVWQNETSGRTQIRYMPKGLDRVFQGCEYDAWTSSRQYCGPVQAFLESSSHPSYLDMIDGYNSRVPYTSSTCGGDVGILLGFGAASATLSIVLLGTLCLCMINVQGALQ